MQRIDENTYIDDTLVTCAEYQIFIDEMREQGKYYQPDHWTSYQFLVGKAKEPILGVRQSDALTFCAWLTDREANGWEYRLPKEEEKCFSEHQQNHALLGYWINGEAKFTWIRSEDLNLHRIDLNLAINYARAHNLKSALTSARQEAVDLADALASIGKRKSFVEADDYFDAAQACARDLAICLARAMGLALALNSSSAPALARVFNRARVFDRFLPLKLNSSYLRDIDRIIVSTRVLDSIPGDPHTFALSRAFDRALNNYHALKLIRSHTRTTEHSDGKHDNTKAFNMVRDHALSLNLPPFLNPVYGGILDLDYAVDLNHTASNESIRAITRILARDLAYSRNFSLACDGTLDISLTSDSGNTRDLALNIYIDLLTLQERIAGRSPAFEGIRLVKERTR